MKGKNPPLPTYNEINEFLESIPSAYRTQNPNLFCLRLKANEGSISNYKAPFKKNFYFIALVTNAGSTKITYDNTNVTDLNSFLVFQSPGLVYSFYRDPLANGYLIYFKPECFSFFKPDFDKEFPFFNVFQSNFFKLNGDKFQEFAPHFEEVFKSYENSADHLHRVASIKLLALLYQLKDFTVAFGQWQDGFSSPQQRLFQKFSQLVNNFYLESRNVEDYAQMLNITPNHLSQAVKAHTGKNALGFINERIMTEAKSLIRYTDFDMAEIAYRLDFSDPANFGKFFKKHSGQTPLEFRKSKT
jgi:AraC family transcriptional regulator, transcriptional activator of pobA